MPFHYGLSVIAQVESAAQRALGVDSDDFGPRDDAGGFLRRRLRQRLAHSGSSPPGDVVTADRSARQGDPQLTVRQMVEVLQRSSLRRTCLEVRGRHSNALAFTEPLLGEFFDWRPPQETSTPTRIGAPS